MLIPYPDLIQKYNIRPYGVLHCGANSGQERFWYRENGIQNVIWVEAIPYVFKELLENVYMIPGTICYNRCLSDVDGDHVEFKITNNEGQSSSFLDLLEHKTEHPTVEVVDTINLSTTRLDTLIETEQIEIDKYDFLNLDLQGVELLALRGLGRYLNNFSYLYIEVNTKELYRGCPLVNEIDDYVGGFGFRGVETAMTGSFWGDKFYIK